MNRLNTIYRVYELQILKTMGIAFDAAWDVVSKNCTNRDGTRQELSRVIFRLVDAGETDALRLCKLALDAIMQPDALRAEKQTHPNFFVLSGLRSLPGRNWHVPGARGWFSWIDNPSHVNADRTA